MRSVKYSVLLWVMLIPTITWAQVWPNEPAGASTVLDCPFISVTGCGITDEYSSGGLTSESGGRVSPPSALGVRLAPGAGTGGGQWDYYYSTVKEVFVGLSWGTNPGFQGRSTCNKMFFVIGPAGGGVFCFGTGQVGGGVPIVFSHNSSLSNGHACGGDGLFCYPQTNVSVFPGQRYKLEFYIKDSTTTTSRDGIMRWWVNGVLSGNYTNLNLYGGGWNRWTWTPTWDNCGGNQVCDLRGVLNTQEWVHYIDHLHISIPNCPAGGCSGGGGTSPPPATPPPPPPLSLPGAAQDLAVNPTSPTTAVVTFTQQDDGAGSAAAYDNRLAVGTINWGTASSISAGPCATTYRPSGAIGTVVSCLLSGLTPGQSYQLQNVSLRGTPNQGATYAAGLSNVASFTMPFESVPDPAPVISGFSPVSGLEGVSVVVTGTDFSPTIGSNTVKLNGQTVTVTAAGSTSLTFTVPSGATSGRISVQTATGTSVSDGSFAVTPAVPPVESNGCGCS